MTSSIIARAKAILLKPLEEWPKIAGEETTTREVFMHYVLPLAVLAPVAGFIGGQVFGYGALGFHFRPPFVSSLIGAVVAFVLAIVSFFILTLIADFLAPKFGGEHSNERSFKLVAYSTTAVWVAGLFALFPPLSLLTVLGLYSLYLIYTGVTPMLGVPKDKALGYTAVLVLCGLVLNFVVAGLSMANMSVLGGMGLIGNSSTETSGTVSLPDGTKVDTVKIEQFGKEMEQAANGKRPPVAPAKLQALLPASIGGFTRSATSSTGMGMASNAEGTYSDTSGHSYRLKITDMSAIGAIAGIGAAMGVEQNSEDANGYEKTGVVDGKMQSEAWHKDSNSGKFSVVVGNRFSIEADGSAGSVDDLKAAVASVDQGALAGLVE
ncbi:MAG: YIP1 family protein [Sphingomonadales bacterium]|nr:YIP1 family protein [Sphingomonadales bacterium]